jgi:hypothetical protein
MSATAETLVERISHAIIESRRLDAVEYLREHAALNEDQADSQACERHPSDDQRVRQDARVALRIVERYVADDDSICGAVADKLSEHNALAGEGVEHLRSIALFAIVAVQEWLNAEGRR